MGWWWSIGKNLAFVRIHFSFLLYFSILRLLWISFDLLFTKRSNLEKCKITAGMYLFPIAQYPLMLGRGWWSPILIIDICNGFWGCGFINSLHQVEQFFRFVCSVILINRLYNPCCLESGPKRPSMSDSSSPYVDLEPSVDVPDRTSTNAVQMLPVPCVCRNPLYFFRSLSFYS